MAKFIIFSVPQLIIRVEAPSVRSGHMEKAGAIKL